MKKTFIRFGALMLVFVLLLSSASAASQVQPRYAKLNTVSSELISISLAGRATCSGYATIWDSNCNLTLYVELQQSSDGVTWSAVKSWNTTGNRSAAIEGYWYVSSGYQYQVVTTAMVYDSTGAYIEMGMAQSAIIEY